MPFDFDLKSINKSILILFFLTAFYTVSLFLAPLTLEPSTAQGLDGNANMVDYRGKWDDMSPYHEGIYLFSDFNCHQKHNRSYSINQNQMPVCARDVGIFIGLTFGFLIMCFIRSRADYKDIILDVLPMKLNLSQRNRDILLVLLGAAFVLPLVLDGGIQLITSYESNNPLRTVTGLLFGTGFSIFISSLLLSAFTGYRVNTQ